MGKKIVLLYPALLTIASAERRPPPGPPPTRASRLWQVNRRDLPLLSQPGQGLQGQGAAAVIEVGQGVVQHQRTGSSAGSTSSHTARRTAR